jgi:hypothetical protein
MGPNMRPELAVYQHFRPAVHASCEKMMNDCAR